MESKYTATPTSEAHYNEPAVGITYPTYQSNTIGSQQQQQQHQYMNLSVPDTSYRPLSASPPSTADLEKSARSTHNTIALPFLRKRVSKKTFFIVIGIIVAIVVILIVVGIAVGVTKANSKRNKAPRTANKALGLSTGGSDSTSTFSAESDNSQEDGNDSSSSSSDTDDTSFSTSNDSSDTGSSSSSSSSNTSSDPCVQLQNAGAGIDAISNCLSQKHQTTMNIIDNFGSGSGTWSIIKRK